MPAAGGSARHVRAPSQREDSGPRGSSLPGASRRGSASDRAGGVARVKPAPSRMRRIDSGLSSGRVLAGNPDLPPQQKLERPMRLSAFAEDPVARPHVVVLVSHVHLGRMPSRLASAVESGCREFTDAAEVTILDRPFADSLDSVRALGSARRLDVLVCAGATGAYLRKRVA